jgi:hypothetical protein
MHWIQFKESRVSRGKTPVNRDTLRAGTLKAPRTLADSAYRHTVVQPLALSSRSLSAYVKVPRQQKWPRNGYRRVTGCSAGIYTVQPARSPRRRGWDNNQAILTILILMWNWMDLGIYFTGTDTCEWYTQNGKYNYHRLFLKYDVQWRSAWNLFCYCSVQNWNICLNLCSNNRHFVTSHHIILQSIFIASGVIIFIFMLYILLCVRNNKYIRNRQHNKCFTMLIHQYKLDVPQYRAYSTTCFDPWGSSSGGSFTKVLQALNCNPT